MRNCLCVFLLFLIHFSLFSQNAVFEVQPFQPFDTLKLPKKPIYSDLKYWAAHPQKNDFADKLPDNNLALTNNQAQAEADVFFVYPTIFTNDTYKDGYWNASVDDNELNAKIDKGTIMNQATVFNGSCKIYSPLYRQANLAAYYIQDKETALTAFEFAYQDVKEAFEYYLKNENNGRPIVIASHSQGTKHAVRLIKEYFDSKPLKKQLVVAYLIGMPIKPDTFQEIKPMYDSLATGGFVSWCTFQENFYPIDYEKRYKSAVVVNPMTWTNDESWIPREKNHGIVSYKFNLVPKVLESRCNNGILWIKTPFVMGRAFVHKNNWHIADYNLFWMNTRENVALRIKEYLLKNK